MKAILTRILIAVMLLTTIAGVPTLAEGERETISVGSAFVFRDGFFDEDVVKVLKDALNIEIKYTFYDADKFSLMLASNDLPDIVCTTQSHLATILENHMALNIDTMIKKSRKEMAVTVMELPDLPSEDALAAIRALPGVIRVRTFMR